MMIADDNRIAVGGEAGDPVTMIFARAPGKSYSKRFPNLPRKILSLQLVRAAAEGTQLRRVREITIGRGDYYYGVLDYTAETPVRSLQAFFWNDKDAFEVKAATLSTRFDRLEPIFTSVLQSLDYLPRPLAEPAPAPSLLPLPVAYSAYVRPLLKTAEVSKSGEPGLPGNFVRVRHAWGTGWMEALVRQDELLQVRRKVVLLPFGNPELEAQAVIELDLQNAAGIKTFSGEFRVWVRNVLAAFLRNYPVDTRRREGPVSVHFQRDGGDLVVDYARMETARALEEAARAR